MRTVFYKTRWNMDGTLDGRLAKVKAAGYEGFEDWVSDDGQADRRSPEASIWMRDTLRDR